jgi:RNA 2',3'-cyclic 3'-phosphodiesterase
VASARAPTSGPPNSPAWLANLSGVRLFVAIVPPPDVVAELDERTAALHPAWPGVRWTSPASWHVTLAFLGEVAEQVRPGLHTRLERAARRHAAQDLAVRGGGAFPRPRRATAVWAGLQADHAALSALAASVAAGARRAGAPPPDEGRRYQPHLTLAYLREPTDVSALVEQLATLTGTGWTASSIELIRSRLPGPEPGRRPSYETLATWPLRSPAVP